MTIRLATISDIETIMMLIDEGRKKMIANGNTKQWTNGEPSRQRVENDIKNGNSYLVLDQEEALATFALVKGPDATYKIIYKGAWKNDRPYYVIHRVASAPKAHGIMRAILDYAFQKTDTIRIDTHEDNQIMQGLLKKNGFEYCGIIYLDNGDPRLAFQKTIEPKLTQI